MADAHKQTPGEIISNLKQGQFTTLAKVIAGGALQARRLSTGAIKFYWRYTFSNQTSRVEIGLYDSKLPPKTLAPQNGYWSVAAAISEATRLAQAHKDAKSSGGYAGLVKAKAEAKDRAIQEELASKAIEQAESERRSKFTLTELLKAYWSNLEVLGRSSHREAKSILTKHAITAFPQFAILPAAEINDEQIADMIRRLFEVGKARTANKLRAYLGAAYETARKARTDPKIPVAFKGFEIRHNPAAETAANSEANKADKNPLSEDDLRVYWTCIKDLDGIKGATLKLHLLTGGQRIEQLVRLRSSHITQDSITLFDIKGRPGQSPRKHVLPLIPEAAEAIQLLDLSGEHALSTGVGEKHGNVHLSGTTLSSWAAEAVGDSITGFQTKRIRSGVETLLASRGVSLETRGRLQSHGLSGVQARHYDAYDYMNEKRAALGVLYRELTRQKSNNVVAINSA